MNAEESFNTVSRNDQIGWFGQDQAVEPPDTQLAVGATELVEMTNSSGSVWDKTGPLLARADLNLFYPVPSGSFVSDPKVLYDSATARWFSSILVLDSAFDSQVLLAVSATDDPTGTWLIYAVGGRTAGILEDQPKLGVSTDKIVLSWDDANGSGAFLGGETWILEKASALLGGTVANVRFGPDTTRFGLVPAVHQAASSVAYLAYNGNVLRGTAYGGAYAGVVAISGTPAQANVVWTQTDLAIVPTQLPPNAQQPQGPAIDTGDDRFTSAVWQNDTLWVAGNDACIVSPSPATSCARLIEVSTAGAPTVKQDTDAGAGNGDFYYPAVALDSLNNMFVVFTESGKGSYPLVVESGEQAGSLSLEPLGITAAGYGQFFYDCGKCLAARGGDRWGDYSAAEIDPSVPTTVWVAGEYVPSKTDQADWGTAVVRLTFTTPSRLLNFGFEASSWGRGRLDVFQRGNDDALWHKFYASSSGWSDWSSLGMPPSAVHLASDPVAVSWGAGRIDVFVMGADSALWHKYYDITAGGWSSWYSHGGVLTSGPTATSWGNGRLDVFYRGSHNTLRHIFYAKGVGWSSEFNHGGALASDPSAVSWGVGRIDVVVRGTDGTLQHDDYDGARGGWLPAWEAIGGAVLASGPTITTWGPGRLDVFAQGTDTSLQHNYFYGGSWQGWTSQVNPGNQLASDPGGVAWSAGRIDIFAGQAKTMLHKFYDVAVGWSDWYLEYAGVPPGPPG